MSKEQTPIDEFELLEYVLNHNDFTDKSTLECISKIKEYTNAKVLEALERDLKDLSDCYKAHAEDNPRKEVCQVLHTLIMEKQEQIAQTKQK